MEFQRIDDFIDLDKTGAQKAEFVKQLTEIREQLQAIGKVEVKLNGAGSTKDTVKGLSDAKTAQDALTQSTVRYNKNLETAIDLKARYNGSTKDHIQNADKLAAAELKTAKAANENAKASDNSAKAKEREARYIKLLEAQKEKAAKNAARESKIIEDLANDYKQLSLAYEAAALKAKNLALQVGVNHPTVIEAAADAKLMADKLKELDAITGRHTRNVGNYASAQFALTQVIREAPAFANSFATGISAISNNIPMLLDEFKKLRQSGLSTGGAFGVLSKSLLSFGALLPIGFLLVQAYGKEIATFVKELFKGKEAINQLKLSQDTLNKSFENSSVVDAVASVTELRNAVDLAKKGFGDKDTVVKKYNDTIGKVIGEVKNLDGVEKQLVDNGDKYIQMMLLKAAANLALQEGAKAALKAARDQQRQQEEFLTGTDKFTGATAGQVSAPGFVPGAQEQATSAQIKFLEAQSKRRKEAAVKQSQDEEKTWNDIAKSFQQNAEKAAAGFKPTPDKGTGSKDDIERSFKERFEIIKRNMEAEIKYLNDVANAEGMSVKTRMDARKKANELEKELINFEKDYEISQVNEKLTQKLKNEKLTASAIAVLRANAADEISNIESKAAVDQLAVQQSLSTDLLKIWSSYRAKDKAQREADLALFKDDAEARRKAAQERATTNLDKRTAGLSTGRDSELIALETRRKKKLITEKEYNEERLRIETDYNKLILLADIDFLEAQIAIKKANGEDVTALEAKVAAARLKISKDANDAIAKSDADAMAKKLAMIDRIQQVASEVATTIQAFVTGDIDRQKNEVQEQMDLVDKKKAKEIEAIQQTLLSEQDKAAQIQIVNARAQGEKERLERRQRQLDQERARAEKAFNIARIVMDTAAAIAKTIAQLGMPAAIPFIAASGAIGAAQLARVIATPIPKFATGTEDAPGGIAWVGDGGRKEMVIDPQGNVTVTPDKPTLMDVPKHSVILPDADAVMKDLQRSAFKRLGDAPIPESNINAQIITALEKEIRSLKSVVANKRELNIKGTHGGVVALHNWAMNQRKYIDEQTNF